MISGNTTYSAGSDLSGLLRQDTRLWDLYTLRHEYSPPREDVCRSIFVPGNRKEFLRPIASRYLSSSGMSAEYPEGKKFAVMLSHDVDDVYPPFPHTLLSSACYAKRLQPGRLGRELLWRAGGKQASPYRNFREIMEIEGLYGAKSSFYFMTADRDIKRFRYDIADLESDLGFIADSGWEVGLHGGFYACTDLAEMIKEKRLLERVLNRSVIGYRNHYLRFRVPDTWELLAQAGFKYDTTLGYNDVLGCRNGMCHPFRPFNLKTGMEIDLVEIPLIIMDGTLFKASKSPVEAFEMAKGIIDEVEQCNGVVTLLWHNNVFSSAFREEWKKIYINILKYSYKKNAWLTSGEEIWKWSCRNDCSTDGQ
ncbi:MAG TPA: polysaccharide deacetylase family protein [Methanocella sp.]|nr:polysaccharide deacetylase family protein [Methanocella sp.]